MKLEDVNIVGESLVLATAAEVENLASRLWITFPSGYREYITQLGEGVLGGSFIRIYPPWRIENELEEWRNRINKYWLWDKGRDLLPKDRAVECIIIGDTLNGDELLFHPNRPDRLFILPRHSEKIYDAGVDLLEAIEWMCGSGKLTKRFKERDFEPFDSRIELKDRDKSKAVIDPADESLDELIGAAERWVKRHGARRESRKEMREATPPGGNGELIYEGILINAPGFLDPGYGAAWKISDKNGKLRGIFRWSSSEGSEGSTFDRM